MFLGSGLLLLAMLFMSAAMVGGILIAFGSERASAADEVAFHFARAATFSIMNVYTVKVAGVFMVSTSTIIIYTTIVPRWMAFLGYSWRSMSFLAASFLIGRLFSFLFGCS